MGQNELQHSLLDCNPPEGYLQQWKNLLTKERIESVTKKLTSVVVFRVHDEWIAIASDAVKEIVEMKEIHSIPHKTSPFLLGTANIRGQLKLVVSLHKILEINEKVDNTGTAPHLYQRMLVLKQDSRQWVIIANEVLGVFPFDPDKMENVPVTVSKSAANYLKGIAEIDNKSVGILEEELVFFSLQRSIS